MKILRVIFLCLFIANACLEADSAPSQTIPCESRLPGHKMTTRPNGVYELIDGRRMIAMTHNVGGCGSYSVLPTGSKFNDEYTLMSYQSDVSTETCLIKKRGNNIGVYDSFQAIVIEADGFKWTPALSVDDIDSLVTTAEYDGRPDSWRESAVVFGVSDGRIVHPAVSFASGTMLRKKTYVVTRAALAEIGLGWLGEVTAVGSEFDETKPSYNCPIVDPGIASRCRMKIDFSSAISHLVILYGATQKSRDNHSAAIIWSDLSLPCSCMCSTTSGRGVMYTENPQKPGTCFRVEATQVTARTACDMLATESVCTFEYKRTMTRTGPQEADGNYPCESVVGPTMIDVQSYKPSITP